ncbi:MAG: T9SS type A sorting domain-containing protein [Saprospiraceae bacterium]|nr:T9SS type A sorting domain-containing protein [Saprospiraceae bacterium]
MKQFFTLLVTIVFLLPLQAQTCLPDSTLANADFPVQPPPYDPTTFPDGGINDTACINTPFDFVFSAVVGDTFNLGIAMLPLDSIRMPVSNAIVGIPTGLNYACNPPTCVFKKNTLGCIDLYGEITDNALVGEHELKISVQVFLNGSPQPINFVLPDGQLIMGKYNLVVREESFTNCATVSATSPFESYTTAQIVPNPAIGNATLEIRSEENNEAQLDLFSITGKKLMAQTIQINHGTNRIPLQLENLPEGLIVYVLSNEKGMISGKFSHLK